MIALFLVSAIFGTSLTCLTPLEMYAPPLSKCRNLVSIHYKCVHQEGLNCKRTDHLMRYLYKTMLAEKAVKISLLHR